MCMFSVVELLLCQQAEQFERKEQLAKKEEEISRLKVCMMFQYNCLLQSQCYMSFCMYFNHSPVDCPLDERDRIHQVQGRE